MHPPLGLSESDYRILKGILAPLNARIKIYAFGSRVKETARKYSDLDLILKDTKPVPADLKRKLRESLEESDITIRVDILDWAETDEGFRKIIDEEKQLVVL